MLLLKLMKKYFPQNSKSKKVEIKKSSIKFHLDDKGRRVFDFGDGIKEAPKEDNLEEPLESLEQIEQNKKDQIKIRMENKIKNLQAETSVFKCEKCNMIFTDNTSYKEHLNGKLHNQMIGNNLNIKNSSVSAVKDKLLKMKREREQKIKLEKEAKKQKEKEIKEEKDIKDIKSKRFKP